VSFIEATEVLGNLGNFLGSIAVLATLVYLSVQMRQANRNSQLAAMQANRAERRAWFLANRDSPYLPAIEVKLRNVESLDPEESRRYQAHLACDFALFYSERVNRDVGIAGEYAVSDEVYLFNFTTSPPHRDWWKRNGRLVYPPRFCDYMDEAFADSRRKPE
jgi:hypothetical protein